MPVTGLCLGSEAFCHGHHGNHNASGMEIISHSLHAHTASPHLHQSDDHKSHDCDSTRHCCQSVPEKSSECVHVYVMPDTSKSSALSLAAVLPSQIFSNSFSLDAKDCAYGFSNSNNPSLESLRTVILLT